MTVFERLFTLVVGLFLSLFAFADEPGRMGEGMMGGNMMSMFDMDGNGAVSPEEAHEGLQSMLSDYDADGNGTLSIDEFASLHAKAMRETMVDRFQMLDADGDGSVDEGFIVNGVLAAA